MATGKAITDESLGIGMSKIWYAYRPSWSSAYMPSLQWYSQESHRSRVLKITNMATVRSL